MRGNITHRSGSAEPAKINQFIDTQDGSVYGPEAWKIWNVEILDVVPPAPQVDLSKKNKVLLYIPQRIRVKEKEQDLTLTILKEISGVRFNYFSESAYQAVKEQNWVAPGWVLIDKNVIPESRGKDCKQLSPKRRKLYCPPLSGNMPVAYITGSNDGSRS